MPVGKGRRSADRAPWDGGNVSHSADFREPTLMLWSWSVDGGPSPFPQPLKAPVKPALHRGLSFLALTPVGTARASGDLIQCRPNPLAPVEVGGPRSVPISSRAGRGALCADDVIDGGEEHEWAAGSHIENMSSKERS
jgi:hypothetical protein